MRSGSFNDVSAKGQAAALDVKRKRWLVGRSESLRSSARPPHPKRHPLGPSSLSKSRDDDLGWSGSPSPESDLRRGSLPPAFFGSPIRDRSLDRVARLERRGVLGHSHSLDAGGGDNEPIKMKGFVNR
jgi:hypothetical protein